MITTLKVTLVPCSAMIRLDSRMFGLIAEDPIHKLCVHAVPGVAIKKATVAINKSETTVKM